MRVLTVLNTLGPGGTERAAQNYTLGYKEAGEEVAVLAFKKGGYRQPLLQDAGIPVFIGGETETAKDIAIQQALKWHFDIIHIHRSGLSDPCSAYVLEKLRSQARLVMETNVFSRVDDSPARHLVDVHLQLSKWCLWKWSQWGRGLRPAPVGVVLPYIVRADNFIRVDDGQANSFRSQHNIPPTAPLLGRVGQPLSAKWSPKIFDVFSRILEHKPETHLVLVGMPESLQKQYNNLPERIRRNIRLLDFLYGDEELSKCYSALDLFLHIAQIGESFGMVLAEAMMCQCPVVTLSTPMKDNSQVEVVGHLKGGIVASDLDGVVKGVLMLLNDRQLSLSIKSQCRETVIQRFGTAVVMENLFRIIHHATTNNRRDELRRNLVHDQAIISEVSSREIYQMLSNTLGTISLRDRIGMQLVHSPFFYKLWRYRRWHR